MRSILLTTGLLLLAGWLGWSCQSGDPNIGRDIVNPNQLAVEYTDSISLFTSTIAVTDTFATSGDTTLLTGQWSDPLSGKTNASSFSNITFPGNTLASLTDIVYDSLVLELPYSYVYGDTNQVVTLQAFRLKSALIDGRIYYNNNNAAVETTPFTQKVFAPRPRSGREAGLVRIRLSDDLGQELYGKIRDRSIETANDFRAYLPGLAFTTTTNNSLFIGFSANYSNIALYYHQLSASTTRIAVRFNLNGTHFNREFNDFRGTPLQALKTKADRVPSTATNNTTFMTVGPALRTRIDIPALAGLSLSQGLAGVNGAQLIIQPVFRTQRDYLTVGLPVGRAAPFTLPGGLLLYETNENNDLVAVVPAVIGGSTGVTATYNYNRLSLDLQDNYVFDISQYILQIIRNQRQYRPLIMIYSAPGLSRLTVGDRFNATDPLRMRLFLTFKK